MARLTKLMILMRTAMASLVAVSIAGPARPQTLSEAAEAYKQAVAAGTVEALEAFIEQYPLSPQANDAFRDIVVLSRGSSLSNQGPTGLFTTTAIGQVPQTRGIDPY